VVKSLGPAVIYKDLNGAGQELQNRAVIRFQKSLTISGIGETNVINIKFKHKSSRMAATTLETVMNLYLERHLEVHKRRDPQGFFRKQYLLLKDQTKLAEEKLQAFRNQHDLTALDEEQSLLLRQEADLSTELNGIVSQEAETRSRIRQLHHHLTMTPETVPMDDQRLRTLQARLVELELQEHEVLTKYSDQSRLVKRVREEIAIVRRKVAEQKSDIILQEILRNEVELQAMGGKEETKMAQLTAIRKRHEKLNRLVLEFDRLRQAVEVLREKYRLYLTKFEEARISEAMDREKIANVRLIEPVHIPIKPVNSTVGLRMVLATILGAVGGLGMAFFSEYLEDSLERDEDVENLLHLPVLASIPLLEN